MLCSVLLCISDTVKKILEVYIVVYSTTMWNDSIYLLLIGCINRNVIVYCTINLVTVKEFLLLWNGAKVNLAQVGNIEHLLIYSVHVYVVMGDIEWKETLDRVAEDSRSSWLQTLDNQFIHHSPYKGGTCLNTLDLPVYSDHFSSRAKYFWPMGGDHYRQVPLYQ